MSSDVTSLSAAPARWRPTPLTAASVALHGGVAVACIAHFPILPYALGALLANHAVLGTYGMLPRSTALGPNISRLPPAAAARGEIALTFDDGPDPVLTPRVLDLLDAANARATFFCIADAARNAPGLCREIVQRGHAVENHSFGHNAHTFPLLGLGGFRREITAAQQALADITGVAPRYFRAPAGLRNPMLDPILHELDLKLVSWTRRAYDTRVLDAERVARRLIKGLAAGDILLLHDGHRHGERAPVLHALPLVLRAVREQRLHFATIPQALHP